SGAVPNPLPWEDRPRVPFADALVDTVRLFISNPREAWSRTRESGDLGQPILFAICVGWVAAAFNLVWSMMFGQAWLRFVPPNVRDVVRHSLATSGGMIAAQVILAPLFIVIGLFIGAAIIHLCILVVGGLSNSKAGFEGTVRILGYSWVAQLAQIIPVFGGLIAAIWALVLNVMGIERIHRTTQGKAIAAVLIPVILCCGCVLLALVIGGAALLSAFGKMR
ncbi:MAG TPA: YIP1 family protein, partial [Thermoanaerobaculia bacterium]|nr:YIP1 family protein [Thermoanaerobaculia bacterium]